MSWKTALIAACLALGASSAVGDVLNILKTTLSTRAPAGAQFAVDGNQFVVNSVHVYARGHNRYRGVVDIRKVN